MSNKGRHAGFAAIACLALAGCGPSGDTGAIRACREFRSTLAASREGALSTEESRARMQKIDEEARGADDPQIRELAHAMLAGVTTGTAEQAAAAGQRLIIACGRHPER